MGIYQRKGDYVHLLGARVACVPILVPHVKSPKTKLVFIVLCGDKEYMCIVYGKTALRLCNHIGVGHEVNVYGKEKARHKRPNVYVHNVILPKALAMDATFKVEKSKMWDYLSKVPVVSRFVPEAMRV